MKNNCIDCKKEISAYYAKRCRSCSKKGKLNPSFNMEHSENKRRGTHILGECCECSNETSDYSITLCASCVKIGERNPLFKKIPWNKDIKTNIVPWNKGLVLVNMSGENHWNWQGGLTSKNEKIRKSAKYKDWRKKVFERDNYCCVFCKKIGIYLHADHIKPFSLFPELRLSVENGRTLCVECHRKTDTYGSNLLINSKCSLSGHSRSHK